MVSSPNGEDPFVSVVLPTRNRSALLRNCLTNGLFRQSYPRDHWEIVVVNDGSVDDTQQVLAELCALSPVPIRTFTLEGRGAAVARNYGTQQAQGTIVAHIDDDGCPVPQWLEAGVKHFGANGASKVAIVSGPIVPNPAQEVRFFSFVSESYEDRGIYPTSNIFFRRDLFLAQGGFSETFGVNRLGRPAWGWDTDLAWRIRRQGYQAVFVPEAVTHDHVFDLTPGQWLREPWKAHVLPNLIRVAPEARDGFLRAYPFFDDAHRWWVIGLVGLLLATRWRWLAVLMLPWLGRALWDQRAEVAKPWRWPVVAVKTVFLWLRQLVLFVSLLYGSIRYGRLAL